MSASWAQRCTDSRSTRRSPTHRPAVVTSAALPASPAPQENIVSVRAPRPVRHPLVDQLFIRFDPEAGTYIAGPQLRSAFPHEF